MGVLRLAGAILVSAAAVSCASMPATKSGALTTYDKLAPESSGSELLTFVDEPFLRSAKSVSIKPARLKSFQETNISPRDRSLLTNSVDRSLCTTLSERFEVVPFGHKSDMVVTATITNIRPTNVVAATASKAATLGSSIVFPVGVPRLPLGLGGIAIEFEALDVTGRQRAALTWAKGANILTSSARVSRIGDAYGLSSEAGRRFGRMLSEAVDRPGISLPTSQRMATLLGAPSGSQVCRAFGRSPGLVGVAGGLAGVPPSWTDGGYEP